MGSLEDVQHQQAFGPMKSRAERAGRHSPSVDLTTVTVLPRTQRRGTGGSIVITQRTGPCPLATGDMALSTGGSIKVIILSIGPLS